MKRLRDCVYDIIDTQAKVLNEVGEYAAHRRVSLQLDDECGAVVSSHDLKEELTCFNIAARYHNVHLPRFVYDGSVVLNSELLIPLSECAPQYTASMDAYDLVQTMIKEIPQSGFKRTYTHGGLTLVESV